MRSTCPCWVPARTETVCGLLQRLDLDLGAQGRLGHPDGQRRVEVVALALETGVGGHHQMHEERPSGATPLAGRAPIGQAQGRAVVDPGRHLDGEGALLDAATLAAAIGAGIRDRLAQATAAWGTATAVTTWPSSDWRTRRSSPTPWQSAQVIGSVPGAVPRSGTRVAGDRQAHRELLAAAEDGLGEFQADPHLGVGTRRRTAAPTAAAGHLAEEGLEDVAQPALEAESAGPPPPWSPKTPSGPKRS